MTPPYNANDDLPDLSAFEYLPLPLVVLSSQKTVLVASEAVTRLLGWSRPTQEPPTHPSDSHPLVGYSLSQLGITLSKDQNCSELELEAVLDVLASQHLAAIVTAGNIPQLQGNEAEQGNGVTSASVPHGDRNNEHDVWPEDDFCNALASNIYVDIRRRPGKFVNVRMSARLWSTSSTIMYVLTFSRPSGLPITPTDPEVSGPIRQAQPMERMEDGASDWKVEKLAAISRMKNAVFDIAQFPGFLFTAGEEIYFPNNAARHLTGQFDDCMLEHGHQILARLDVYDENYTKTLDINEHPVIKLIRTRKNFKEEKYGFCDPTGKRVWLDLSGDCLYDELTGEFLGGVVWCRDVTDYTEMIAQQRRQIERGFEDKLDFMPNLSWTASSSGHADYFSRRWYEYTGAKRRSGDIRTMWKQAVHPDDQARLWQQWEACLTSGDDLEVEARYKRFDGLYRWQLVRAVPQRDNQGEIIGWYGACADIHDLVMKRLEASHRRQQIFAVLSHAEVNLFGFNKNMEVTMLEGSVKWGVQGESSDKQALVGSELVDIVEKTTDSGASGATDFIQAVQQILSGESTMEVLEHSLDGRWYRSRIIADLESDNTESHDIVVGALGLSLDITDLKARSALEIEKTQLLANEHAAKEANMLKSQFLANVSHELRTPIAGVLGMADLLRETPLEAEQIEYTRGIQQSADSLLGIVNDILDASKIEAGRFNIESVQFDLAAVLNDLVKLMAFAAQGKGLTLNYKSVLEKTEPVIGDPGRTRQILVNLLTNGIKFTNKGMVTLSVTTREMHDVLEVAFVVEDTGIGIEEGVLRKLFRPFSQGNSSTARLFGGTGLGLMICREVCEMQISISQPR